jgi:hypothetical protein
VRAATPNNCSFPIALLATNPDDYAHAIARPHQGAAIDTTTAAGKLVFGIFAALAEFEREHISERTRAMPVEDKTQSNCDLFPAGRKILAFGAARTGPKILFRASGINGLVLESQPQRHEGPASSRPSNEKRWGEGP